jgi:hypothetical protein
MYKNKSMKIVTSVVIVAVVFIKFIWPSIQGHILVMEMNDYGNQMAEALIARKNVVVDKVDFTKESSLIEFEIDNPEKNISLSSEEVGVLAGNLEEAFCIFKAKHKMEGITDIVSVNFRMNVAGYSKIVMNRVLSAKKCT